MGNNKPKYIGVRCSILGREWEIRFYSDKKYFKAKDTEPGTAAVTIAEDYRILVNRSMGALQETITHELTHAYLHMLCIKSANLEMHDMEEIFCEFMSLHGVELLQKSNNVYIEYKNLKEKTN